LPDVGGLLEAAAVREEVLATASANATMEDICKEHKEDKATLQRERKDMQRQVHRLREEVLERDALQGQRNICINRLRELERQLNRLREPLRGSRPCRSAPSQAERFTQPQAGGKV
jgi:hypothetical protein